MAHITYTSLRENGITYSTGLLIIYYGIGPSCKSEPKKV
jgi:hypothetical protein